MTIYAATNLQDPSTVTEFLLTVNSNDNNVPAAGLGSKIDNWKVEYELKAVELNERKFTRAMEMHRKKAAPKVSDAPSHYVKMLKDRLNY
jgi:hypothetical protein